MTDTDVIADAALTIGRRLDADVQDALARLRAQLRDDEDNDAI